MSVDAELPEKWTTHSVVAGKQQAILDLARYSEGSLDAVFYDELARPEPAPSRLSQPARITTTSQLDQHLLAVAGAPRNRAQRRAASKRVAREATRIRLNHHYT